MRNNFRAIASSCVLLSAVSLPASAALMFDASVTPDAIFGSGNANGSWTVASANGVELGLRGKLRHNATGGPENTFNSNGDGTYSFAAGVAPTQSFPTAIWSFEWSINSDVDGRGGVLSDFTYALGLDTDPGAGISYGALTSGANEFDVINVACADHSIGTNGTVNGGGVEASCPAGAATYATLIDNNNVAQNSWKPHWFIAGFDPAVDGQYDLYLAAFDASGALAARTDISIIVGAGAATTVPVPGTLALAGMGLLGFRLRRKM